MALEYNTDGRGVNQHYGTRTTAESKYGGRVPGENFTKNVVYTVDVGNEISGAPATSNNILTYTASNQELIIPAYAKVLSARAEVVEELSTTGGTAATAASVQVGLTQSLGSTSPGTAIDADGLLDATDGALTIAANDIAEPRGTVLVGSNAALVPNVSIGAEPAEVTAVLVIDNITGMTAVAGKIRIIVEYLDEGV